MRVSSAPEVSPSVAEPTPVLPVPRPKLPIEIERLKQGAVGALYELASAGPTSGLMRRVLADRAAMAERMEEAPRAGRNPWLALASDPNLRKLTRDAVLREMTRMSQELGRALDHAAARKVQPYWHTVIVGGGIHATEVANAMAQESGAQSILTIDDSKSPAGKFAMAGETFRINSDNDLVQKGVSPLGNVNPIESPVGLPDIAGTKWPTAQALADAATIGLYTSGSDFLFDSKVTAVTKAASGPGKYLLKMASGREVYADNVVVAAGLGEPQPGFDDPASRALVEAEIAKVDDAKPDVVPDVLLFQDAMRLANLSRSPLEPYRKKRADGSKPVTAVVGNGDGARVFLELLLRYGPDEAYTGNGKNEVSQRGQVGPLEWFVGSKGPKDQNEYTQQVWARYRPLAKSIATNQIALVPARADTIERVASGADAGRLKLTFKDAQGQAQTKIVDRVVLCTGFDNKVGDVLRGTLPAQMQSAKFDAKTPFATSAAVQDVKGAVAPGLSPQTIARQVVGESVYVCGPAAGDLTVGEVLNGPNTNPVSIFNTGPRSAALGRSIALAPGLNAKKFFTPKTLQPALTMSAAGGSATMAVVPDAELPAAPAYSDLQVKTLLSLALDRFRYPGVKKLELEVRQEVQDSARVLVVSSPQLDAASVSKLKAAIEGDRELHGLLTLFTRTGVIREVSFSVQVDAGSDRVWPASMRMTR